MHHLTVTELSRALAAKKVSSRELTDYFLARIAQYDPTLNSFITVTADAAREQAQLADKARAEERAGPLTGMRIKIFSVLKELKRAVPQKCSITLLPLTTPH